MTKYILRSVYDKYFQKSKTFLLPYVLPDRKKIAQPENVYVAWKGRYTVKKKRLIVVYKAGDKSAAFKKAEAAMVASPLFESREVSPDKKQIIFIFNFTKRAKDWNNFLEGKYSKLSDHLKLAILHYYSEGTSEFLYIHSYLYPDAYFEDYAHHLDVSVKLLAEVGELCDKYNPDKETYSLVTEDLEILEKAV
jgi:hypothetical protein